MAKPGTGLSETGDPSMLLDAAWVEDNARVGAEWELVELGLLGDLGTSGREPLFGEEHPFTCGK